MKTIHYYIYKGVLCGLLAMATTSCSNWLDVPLDGTIEAEKMFEDETGFEEALAGVYSQMVNTRSYGMYMITAPDAMAQYWMLPAGTETLYPIKNFNFSHENAETVQSYIWNEMYAAIASDNLLLGHTVGKESMPYYDIIRGEALGLRAYMHLDLLRLYGPRDLASSTPCIPYRTEFSNQSVAPMPASEVLADAEKDLLEAYGLLKNDPIKTVGRINTSLTDYKSELSENFRGCRMNYYAVCAELARLYMLKGDKQKAAQYAQEVIDAKNVFHLYKVNEIAGDFLWQSELVFSLYLGSSLTSTIGSQLGANGGATSSQLATSLGMLQNMFLKNGEGVADDYRYAATMWSSVNGLEGKVSRKYYWASTNYPTNTAVQAVVPMVRITEMYFIVAEANADTPENGVTRQMLNTVRSSRNVPALNREEYTSDELKEMIVDEARRDFVGEGQMFYMYKRLNHDILTENGVIKANDVTWQWARPKLEDQYNK